MDDIWYLSPNVHHCFSFCFFFFVSDLWWISRCHSGIWIARQDPRNERNRSASFDTRVRFFSCSLLVDLTLIGNVTIGFPYTRYQFIPFSHLFFFCFVLFHSSVLILMSLLIKLSLKNLWYLKAKSHICDDSFTVSSLHFLMNCMWCHKKEWSIWGCVTIILYLLNFFFSYCFWPFQ